MSAPKPYKTDPLLPPNSVHILSFDQFQYIYKTVQIIFFHVVCVLEHCTFVIYACASLEQLISRFSAILKSVCPSHGTNWYEIQLDTDSSQYGVGTINVHLIYFNVRDWCRNSHTQARLRGVLSEK